MPTMSEILDIFREGNVDTNVIDVLYHGTCLGNAKALVENGWQPNKGSIGGNMGQTRYLYLTNTPENASWFAEEKGCSSIVALHNVPLSSLSVDPEDGTYDTVKKSLQ